MVEKNQDAYADTPQDDEIVEDTEAYVSVDETGENTWRDDAPVDDFSDPTDVTENDTHDHGAVDDHASRFDHEEVPAEEEDMTHDEAIGQSGAQTADAGAERKTSLLPVVAGLVILLIGGGYFAFHQLSQSNADPQGTEAAIPEEINTVSKDQNAVQDPPKPDDQLLKGLPSGTSSPGALPADKNVGQQASAVSDASLQKLLDPAVAPPPAAPAPTPAPVPAVAPTGSLSTVSSPGVSTTPQGGGGQPSNPSVVSAMPSPMPVGGEPSAALDQAGKIPLPVRAGDPIAPSAPSSVSSVPSSPSMGGGVSTAAPVAVTPVSSAVDPRVDALMKQVREMQGTIESLNTQLVEAKKAAPVAAVVPAGDNATALKERIAKLERELAAARLSREDHGTASGIVVAETPTKPKRDDVRVTSSPKKKEVPTKSARSAAHTSTKTVKKSSPKSVLPTYTLRAATPKEAWVSEGKGSSSLLHIVVGDSLPGIGRITAIQQGSAGWMVKGTEGNVW